MRVLQANGIALHWREDGDPAGAPVVFANSLGTDLRLWDALIPHLPGGYRYIRYDKRGHGLSDVPPAPYDLDMLVGDAEALIEGAVGGPVLFVGLSIGGLIGQGLGVKRPDLVRALVLSNTAAKLGTSEAWEDRTRQVRAGGMAAMSETILDRWFAPANRHGDRVALWRNMLNACPVEGYTGCCAAIAGADLRDDVAGLEMPVLCIAGTDDKATEPAAVAATAGLIPGARLETMAGVGHLPCVEDPATYAGLLVPFLKEHGYA
jgi:3-oxoadipate enol-lactonase